MRKVTPKRIRWMRPALLVAVCLGSIVAATQTPTGLLPSGSRGSAGAWVESLAAMGEAGAVVPEEVDRSVNQWEQLDFILAPAFLVQEAVSEDVVPTYPEE